MRMRTRVSISVFALVLGMLMQFPHFKSPKKTWKKWGRNKLLVVFRGNRNCNNLFLVFFPFYEEFVGILRIGKSHLSQERK